MLPEKKVGTPSIVAPVARFERIRFDLSTTPAAEVFTQEMRRVVLQGSISNYVVPDRCNIIESRLARVATDSVDFSRCDFKDNAIVDCRFSETKFVGTGFMLNTVAKSRFLTCNFFDTVIQNCEFYDVEFQDCDFTSLVIKDCHFSHCVFTGCKTSSKLFEMCLLNNCKFSETQLQFQTVIENFGLMNGQVNVPLRSDRVDHPHEQIELQALKAKLLVEVNPLARLALDYFLNGSLLDGSEHLDAALDVQYWIRSQSTIGSFSIVLTRLCEFLLQLHGRDELAYLPLVQFHTVTGALASLVPADARMRQAEFAVYGAHLSLARQIDAFGEAVSRLTRSRRRKLTLLVEDGRAKASYKRELPDLFRRGRPRIVSLTPHNSPWEMVLAFPSSAALGFFAALFLATRTRIEVQRLLDKGIPAMTKRRSRMPRGSQQIARLTFGAAKAPGTKSLLHFTARLSPTLAADFQLSVSTQCIGRIRRIVRALLN